MLRKELFEGLKEDLVKGPVKVLFELDSRNKATLEIVGRSIPVKAAVMTILSELADHYKIPLVTLIEEFLVVAQAVEQKSIEEMLRHLSN